MGEQSTACQYVRSMNRQRVGGEDPFQWLSSGDLKGEAEIEITPTQNEANIMRQKYYQQKEMANVNNLKGQWNTSYHYADYWQKNNT